MNTGEEAPANAGTMKDILYPGDGKWSDSGQALIQSTSSIGKFTGKREVVASSVRPSYRREHDRFECKANLGEA
jgi:hypothetical protein